MSFFNPLQIALKPLLNKAIAEDSLFSEVVKTKTEQHKKSFEECCEYILGEAYSYASKHKTQNTAVAGISDEDLCGLIKHYYDEDNIEVKKIGAGCTAKVSSSSSSSSGKASSKKAQEKNNDNKTSSEPSKNAEAKQQQEEKKESKALTKSELKKGADCYDLFGELLS